MGEKRGRHEREGKRDKCWLGEDEQVERTEDGPGAGKGQESGS